jgi:hypothetical protein
MTKMPTMRAKPISEMLMLIVYPARPAAWAGVAAAGQSVSVLR